MYNNPVATPVVHDTFCAVRGLLSSDSLRHHRLGFSLQGLQASLSWDLSDLTSSLNTSVLFRDSCSQNMSSISSSLSDKRTSTPLLFLRLVISLTWLANVYKMNVARQSRWRDTWRKQVSLARSIHLSALVRGWTCHEYNKLASQWQDTGSPSYCVVPWNDWGSAVKDTPLTFLEQIQPGREGWIYLVQAEGTNRYKIGRSRNLITRIQDLQKQSPYPLKLIRTAWTVDAIADEAELHNTFAKHRVFGEWFNLEGIHNEEYQTRRLEEVDLYFDSPSTMWKLCRQASEWLCCQLSINDLNDFEPHFLIIRLYASAKSRQEIAVIEKFFINTLVYLIFEAYGELKDCHVKNGKPSLDLCSFINGCINTFAFVVLNRKI